MSPRTGDVIHIVEELDALPVGSVVLASTGKAYQRARDGGERGYGVVWAEAGGAYLTQPLVMVRWAPLTVLHVPGEQEPTALSTEGRARAEERERITLAIVDELARTTATARPEACEYANEGYCHTEAREQALEDAARIAREGARR